MTYDYTYEQEEFLRRERERRYREHDEKENTERARTDAEAFLRARDVTPKPRSPFLLESDK